MFAWKKSVQKTVELIGGRSFLGLMKSVYRHYPLFYARLDTYFPGFFDTCCQFCFLYSGAEIYYITAAFRFRHYIGLRYAPTHNPNRTYTGYSFVRIGLSHN